MNTFMTMVTHLISNKKASHYGTKLWDKKMSLLKFKLKWTLQSRTFSVLPQKLTYLKTTYRLLTAQKN